MDVLLPNMRPGEWGRVMGGEGRALQIYMTRLWIKIQKIFKILGQLSKQVFINEMDYEAIYNQAMINAKTVQRNAHCACVPDRQFCTKVVQGAIHKLCRQGEGGILNVFAYVV